MPMSRRSADGASSRAALREDVREHLIPRSAGGCNRRIQPEHLVSIATPPVASDPQCNFSPLSPMCPDLGAGEGVGNLVQDRVSHLALLVEADQRAAQADGLGPVVAASEASGCAIESKVPVVQLV
jgi:hypothetical protein